MIESFYNLMAMFGFTHPIHPIVVHAPMGLVIGSVAFSLASFVWTNKHFEQSAYHCALLALISVVPVYIAGLLDWQYVFAGDWSKWIVIKMILGIVLTVALAFAVQQKAQHAGPHHLVDQGDEPAHRRREEDHRVAGPGREHVHAGAGGHGLGFLCPQGPLLGDRLGGSFTLAGPARRRQAPLQHERQAKDHHAEGHAHVDAPLEAEEPKYPAHCALEVGEHVLVVGGLAVDPLDGLEDVVLHARLQVQLRKH